MSQRDDFDPTEDAIARLFAEEYEGKLTYDHSEQRWYEYWDGIWHPDRTNRPFEYARILTRLRTH